MTTMLLLLLTLIWPALATLPPPPDLGMDPALSAQDAGYLRWVRGKELPETHPDRARDYDFTAGLHGRIAEQLTRWPGRVEATRMGRSVERRPIWAFAVRDPGVPVQQRVLVFAQLHALEWIGAEVAVALLEQLAQAPPPGVEVVIVPIVNPDGRWRAEQDLLDGSVRSYRRANANGVDLNRDFATNRESDVIWSRLPFTRRYYGTSPGPLSQPESQALDALVADGDFDVSVSLHAYGGYIYVPWAGKWENTPDHQALVAQGRVMAAGQPGRPYRVMQLCHWIFFFRALGTELDHMYAVHGVDSYLIELTRSGIKPLQPETWRDYFRWYNPVDPTPHVADGVGAISALVRHLSARAEGRAP